MDAREAERNSKRRRVDEYWVEPIRQFCSTHGGRYIKLEFRDKKYYYVVIFNVNSPTIILIIAGVSDTKNLENTIVIDYCLEVIQNRDTKWNLMSNTNVLNDTITDQPFELKLIDFKAVFVQQSQKYTLSNRNASILSFFKTHGLSRDSIIVLKLPDVSYYVYLDEKKSGIKEKHRFTPTQTIEKDVFWAMNEKGWVKTKLAYPPKIIYTVEKREFPFISQPPMIKSNPGREYTYKLPDDVETFVRECNCNDVLYTFLGYNHTLTDVRFRHGAEERKEIEKKYGLHPAYLENSIENITKREEKKEGEHIFNLSNPLTDNEIRLISHILRDGFLCDINSDIITVYFSAPNEWKHYAYRYGYPVEED